MVNWNMVGRVVLSILFSLIIGVVVTRIVLLVVIFEIGFFDFVYVVPFLVQCFRYHREHLYEMPTKT